VAAVGVLLWINRPGRVGGGLQDLDAFEAARLIEEDLAPQGTVQISDRQAFRAALEEVPHGPPPGLPEPDALPPGVAAITPAPEVHARLLTILEEFLAHLSSADPEAYASWMRSRGHELSRDEELFERCAGAWKYFTGEELPPDPDHDVLFDRLFSEQLMHADEQVRPVAFALADEGARVRYLRLGEQAVGASPSDLFIHTNDGIWRWVGYVVMGARKHWAPPVSLDEVVQRDGYVDCALVSISVLGATGDWIPANIFVYYDPQGEDWHTEQIGIVNAPTLTSTWHY